ncbi:MAG TPA: hypothetical protein VNN73_09185 [Blastocatellia bacterium]|jgi:hypothetical protein|nr:hypothetical protein [Blastocatellia bacterium]
MPASITSLKPTVTRDEAARKLKGFVREIRRGRLALIVEFYIPYRLFETFITNADVTVTKVMAIDAVTGALDPYAFDQPPAASEREIISSERALEAALSEARSLELLEEKIKRGLYLKGFFRVKNPQVRGLYLETIHVPYWVGVYRQGDKAWIEALNAVRGQREGSKVREIITEWFHTHGRR